MLFGSVPSPPKNPKSWTRTQSARQNTAVAMTTQRSTRPRVTTSPTPIPPRRGTHKALTQNP